MRVFKTRVFAGFARKKRIKNTLLCEAVERAERGLIDADLGGGLIKQRIPRPNEGRSGGYRAMLAYKAEDITVFIYGFAKNEQGNVSDNELIDLRGLAEYLLALDDNKIMELLEKESWIEVNCDD